MNLLRLARTVRPLKAVQLYGRAWFRLTRPRPDFRAAAPRRRLKGWVEPVGRPPALVGPDEIILINQPGRIAGSASWNDPAQAKLWLYNLHYFDELSAPADARRQGWRRDLIARWIAENPAALGNGWEPYPTSLRIVNWIKWDLSGQALDRAALDSLATQTRWLTGRLERHLLGNHLFANAKALVFAGLFFEGAEADRWLDLGLRIFDREMPEQILADGGHFELSPMYHSILFEDVLDLINIATAAGMRNRVPHAGWRDVATRMAGWLRAMTHPDGRIAFFNDSAFGVAAEPVDLHAYAARLGVREVAPDRGPVQSLTSSGYIRLESARAVALLDVARVGPDYLPGHAHADTLSFELSVDGTRLLVNGGTSTYAGALRARERGTSSHNTVQIDGLDSSEVWGSFRVGRRANVRAAVTGEKEAAVVDGEHDGYAWRPGGPVHKRRWRFEPGGLVVSDELTGPVRRAVARFHLAPGVVVRIAGDGRSATLSRAGQPAISMSSSSPLRLEPAQWGEGFNRVTPIQALVADLQDGVLRTSFGW
jgi:uncharacterized heparinase superfamily protein